MFDIQNLMSQANKMQEEMGKVEAKLATIEVSSSSGGGLVNATVTCNNRVKSIKISKDILSGNDIEMIEDLVVAAVNKALESAAIRSQEEMDKVTGGLMPNIPGLNLGSR